MSFLDNFSFIAISINTLLFSSTSYAQAIYLPGEIVEYNYTVGNDDPNFKLENKMGGCFSVVGDALLLNPNCNSHVLFGPYLNTAEGGIFKTFVYFRSDSDNRCPGPLQPGFLIDLDVISSSGVHDYNARYQIPEGNNVSGVWVTPVHEIEQAINGLELRIKKITRTRCRTSDSENAGSYELGMNIYIEKIVIRQMTKG